MPLNLFYTSKQALGYFISHICMTAGLSSSRFKNIFSTWPLGNLSFEFSRDDQLFTIFWLIVTSVLVLNSFLHYTSAITKFLPLIQWQPTSLECWMSEPVWYKLLQALVHHIYALHFEVNTFTIHLHFVLETKTRHSSLNSPPPFIWVKVVGGRELFACVLIMGQLYKWSE